MSRDNNGNNHDPLTGRFVSKRTFSPWNASNV